MRSHSSLAKKSVLTGRVQARGPLTQGGFDAAGIGHVDHRKRHFAIGQRNAAKSKWRPVAQGDAEGPDWRPLGLSGTFPLLRGEAWVNQAFGQKTEQTWRPADARPQLSSRSQSSLTAVPQIEPAIGRKDADHFE